MAESAPPGNPSSIMVVDDTPENLRLLDGALRDRGYRVLLFPRGALALQAAERRPPDLVLLDVRMPEMDGFEVCRRLKEHERLRAIPIIFLTASTATEDKVRGFAAGGVDYVTKPFQLEELHARIETHLALRRLQGELEARNRQLEASYQRLLELEALRDALSHMIVHDMRTPLTVASGYAQILDKMLGEQPPAQILVGRLGRALSRLVRMTDDLLDLGRLEEGRLPMQIAEHDLGLLVRQAVDGLTESGIVVESVHPVRVRCDADLLGRVVENLLGNAIKHCPEGGIVRVTVERDGDEARLSVSDQGPGIPPAYREKIFEKYGQVEGRSLGTRRSTGLGLAFCRLAVAAHGGTIGVASEEGSGSTFWFALPGALP